MAHTLRQKIGLAMQQWHSSSGDPIYAVGSFYFAGQKYPQREVVVDALSRIESLIPRAEAGQHGWTKRDAKQLQRIASFLKKDLSETKAGHSTGRSLSEPEYQILSMIEKSPGVRVESIAHGSLVVERRIQSMKDAGLLGFEKENTSRLAGPRMRVTDAGKASLAAWREKYEAWRKKTGHSTGSTGKIIAYSESRYRAPAAHRRAGLGSTITVFQVYRAEDAKTPSKWVRIEGHGPTPGERRTDAIRKFLARGHSKGSSKKPGHSSGRRLSYEAWLGEVDRALVARGVRHGVDNVSKTWLRTHYADGQTSAVDVARIIIRMRDLHVAGHASGSKHPREYLDGATRAETTQLVRELIGKDAFKRAMIKVENTHTEGALRGHGGGVHISFAAVPPGSSEIQALNASNFMLSIDAPAWSQAATSTRAEPDAIVKKVVVRQFRGRTKIRGISGSPVAAARYVAAQVHKALEASGLATGSKNTGHASGEHIADKDRKKLLMAVYKSTNVSDKMLRGGKHKIMLVGDRASRFGVGNYTTVVLEDLNNADLLRLAEAYRLFKSQHKSQHKAGHSGGKVGCGCAR